MKPGKGYLLFWLTIQWLACGPLAAVLSYFMFFSDSHGLPEDNLAMPFLIVGVATIGYATAVWAVLRLQESLDVF